MVRRRMVWIGKARYGKTLLRYLIRLQRHRGDAKAWRVMARCGTARQDDSPLPDTGCESLRRGKLVLGAARQDKELSRYLIRPRRRCGWVGPGGVWQVLAGHGKTAHRHLIRLVSHRYLARHRLGAAGLGGVRRGKTDYRNLIRVVIHRRKQ